MNDVFLELFNIKNKKNKIEASYFMNKMFLNFPQNFQDEPIPLKFLWVIFLTFFFFFPNLGWIDGATGTTTVYEPIYL